MVGGAPEQVARLAPALDVLTGPGGHLHTGPVGSGHFVKMIHNGIEYGLMQAYAEGFELLSASPFGRDLNLPAICDLWNHGSVVRSWLLELAGRAFTADPELATLTGYVEDSGEGRWTVEAALDSAVSAPVITMSVSRPGLLRMASGILVLPTSWNRPASPSSLSSWGENPR